MAQILMKTRRNPWWEEQIKEMLSKLPQEDDFRYLPSDNSLDRPIFAGDLIKVTDPRISRILLPEEYCEYYADSLPHNMGERTFSQGFIISKMINVLLKNWALVCQHQLRFL